MDSLLTVRETADFLKISVGTIYRLTERGLLPRIKKSFGIRINREDLEEWLEQDKSHDVLKNPLTSPSQIHIDKIEGGQDAMPKGKTKRLNCGCGYVYILTTKDGYPRFYHDYKNAEGKRIQESDRLATNWNEAIENLFKKVQREREKKYGFERKSENVGFRDFAKIYLEDYMRTVRRNFRPDVYRLQNLCGHFKNMDLRTITPLMIERFRKLRLKAGNAKTTCNRYLQLLKRMLNVAIDEGYLEKNPAQKVKLYSEKDNLKERILTEEEEPKLLDASSEHLKSILTVALNTGLRRGELLNLKWNQIDFKARMLRVEKTKSGKMRHIPINDVLFNELSRLKSENGQNSYIFFNPETGKPYLDMKTGFKGACRRAGIKGLRFHDLRHTFATRLIQAGVDIVTVQNLLGHHSVTVTQRYTHSNDEQKRKAVELLNKNPEERTEKREKLLNIVTQEIQSKLIH